MSNKKSVVRVKVVSVEVYEYGKALIAISNGRAVLWSWWAGSRGALSS